ncbi:spore coat protein [Paenibacillus sp. BSR1-1]|uniref:spore coat protein n=1 Tax=Paenibacillus sp. BSR1-1 TaxID=3020845 RepID=UPI0025AFB164|nr:spore coat protein [Paenibacillus sp. BSR1-1]MDN3019736.1 spore coat protein [Paenibacillus sp. BSR1-1]
MQNQPQGQMHQNMHTGAVPPQMNHGGHELFDVHEVISSAIGTMNSYLMLRQHVKDPELMDILDRQYQFMQDEYNITLECFKTGQDPSKPTGKYMMKQGNDWVYGMKPSQPKKPWQSASEINDEYISSCMLASCKTGASMKTVAACEVTNPVVRRVLADSVPNCIEMAYELSIYQNKNHYYQVPQLAQQDMQQILNAFAPAQGMPQMQNNMNNMNTNNMNMNNMNH